MRADYRDIIENKYLQIWEDFQVIGIMDLTIAERRKIYEMYCNEVRAVPDNTWCGKCIVEYLRELISLYRNS